MDLKVYALLNAKIKELTGESIDLSKYYTKEEADAAITAKVAEIVADAPEDFDTLKEMSDWISQHEDSAAAMNSAIQQNETDISTLKNDSHTHTNKTVLDGITQVQLDKITANATDISTLKKHVTGELTDSDFQEDSTVAMTKTVPTGMSNYAAISKIGGKTAKFNQIIRDIPISTKTYDASTVTVLEHHTITVDKNPTVLTAPVIRNIDLVSGHKYYFCGCPDGGGEDSYQLDNTAKTYVCTNSLGTIFTASVSESIELRIRLSPNTTWTNKTFKPQMFDLTIMFGSGKEPTVEQCAALFSGINSRYNEGELWNTLVESVVSTSADGTTKTTLLIPEAIKKLPDYGCAVSDTIYNWVDFENGVYHHVCTKKCLGDFTYVSNGGRWETPGSNFSNVKIDLPNVGGISFICSKLEPNIDVIRSASTAPDLTGAFYYLDNRFLCIIKSATTASEAQEFLRNVDIVYELATEELIDISDILHPIRCETGGTITLQNEHNLDMPNTVVYKKEVSLS